MSESFEQRHERRLADAEAGDVEAQREVGANLLSGRSVARDVDAGRAWLERAAKRGDLPSLHLLVQHHLLGGRSAHGPRIAWQLMQRAALLGDVYAPLELARAIAHGLNIASAEGARLYFERTGLEASRERALDLARIAQARGAEGASELLAELETLAREE